jgi:hypothetical protein
MRAWLVRAIVAALTFLAIGAVGLTVLDGWRPAGGDGVPWIEFLLHEEPQARVDDYLRALSARDRDKALALWEIPDRGAPDALGALRDRRQEVTDALLAVASGSHRVIDVQWWSTCCEPHLVPDKGNASIARIRIAIDGATEQRYTFDVRAAAPDRSLLDEVARRWSIADVYAVGEQPLVLRWVATATGSQTLGAVMPPSLKDCGDTEELPPTSYDADARDCVWSAYSSGVPVRWSVMMRTDEGDPTRTILIARPGFIAVTRDMTADRFSAASDRRLWAWQCRMMMRRAWATDPERFFFELTGCSGDGMSASVP